MVNATPYSGRGGARNYLGSVAWYRTSFQAPAAGLYELAFTSANYKAEVFVDGKPLGTHRGSYLPFSFQANLAAGAHALVVRVDWRHPQQQAEEGFHRTWFNWGGLDGEVDIRPIGASDLQAPTISSTLAGATANVKVACRSTTTAPRGPSNRKARSCAPGRRSR